MITYGTSEPRRGLNRSVAIPLGDEFVIEVHNEYRERWDVWGFAASFAEARSILDQANGSSERARIRRLR